MKISLKQLMLIMIGVAFILAILSLATRGDTFALGITVSIAGLTFLFLLYQAIYIVLRLLAKIGFSNHSSAKLAQEDVE